MQDSRLWQLVTTLGLKGRGELGVILPHEHVFLDLRTWESPGHRVAETEEVIRRVAPEISRARKAGVTVIVAPTTLGVGRRVDVLVALSEATGMQLVVPTGVYREPWIPPWVRDAASEELRDRMNGELLGGIEGAGMLIGSHTVRGRVALEQLDVLEAAGLSPERFVWIHAQREPDFSLHLEVARRGAWLEYDGIGRKRMLQGTDGAFVDLLLRALHNGLIERLLLSGDMLGYDASLPNGGEVEPYAYLCETFLPKLLAVGVDDANLHQLTRETRSTPSPARG